MRSILYLFISTISLMIEIFISPISIARPTANHTNFEQAMDLYEHKKYEAAQLAFESYRNQCSKTVSAVDASYYAAVCALRLARVDAEAQIRLFLKNYPEHHNIPQAYYELGKLYENRQDYDQAIAYYNLVDSSNFNFETKVELQYRLAYAYLNQKNFDQALIYFNEIKNISSPYGPGSSYYAGYLILKREEYDTALKDLHHAAKDPAYQFVVPYLILEVYYQAKRFKDLINYAMELEANLVKLKNQADIVFLVAEAYFSLENYEAAIEHYETYLDINKTEIPKEVYYRLGYAFYHKGIFSKALKYLEQVVLQTDALAQRASYYMGMSYIKTNLKNQAIAAFDYAKQLDFIPELQQEAAFQYAQLHAELGNFKIAIEALEQFKQDYSTNTHIATVDNLLSQLYFNSHNYEQTIRYIEGLKNKPESALMVYQKATFYKGTACFNQEDYTDAIQWLQKSLASARDTMLTLETHLWLAESHTAIQAYDQAIQAYQKVIAAAKKDSYFYKNSLYGLAYAYFYRNNYQQALAFFKSYTNQNKDQKDTWHMDALVRIGDCYYMNQSYPNALATYDATEAAHPAHSYYQKALICDLQGKQQEAQAYLNIIMEKYVQTPYYEKALFACGRMALKYKNYPLAVRSFKTFLEKKPYSFLVPEALLNSALAKTNQGQVAEAGTDYEKILNEYPTHTAAQSAVLELSKLLIETNQSNKLQAYIEKYKAANPASQALEAISFEAAKNLFYSQNYSKAIGQLHEFIKSYPDSSLLNEVYFLLAETYYRLGQEADALAFYQLIIEHKKTPFYNRILLRLGGIRYKQQDYKRALGYYKELRERATSKKETYYALEGIMKTSHALQEYEVVQQVASLIVEEGNVTINSVNQAILYLGKAAMHQQKTEMALDYFKQVASKATDLYAAEAQFRIAQVYYQLSNYTASLEFLFALHKKFSSYTEWVDQGFLLMADNYIALKELFQARATLQSIIDHASDTAVIQQATIQLQMLIEQATADSLMQIEKEKVAQAANEFKIIDDTPQNKQLFPKESSSSHED